MRLKIQLPATWTQQNNQNGPVTFCRQGSSSAFQVSWAEYRGSGSPDATADTLVEMAICLGQEQRFGDNLETASGDCKFGTFGSAVFRGAGHPRIQIWFISNGRDHILATHICEREPRASEIAEVKQIVSSLALGPEEPIKSRSEALVI